VGELHKEGKINWMSIGKRKSLPERGIRMCKGMKNEAFV
jgi:hypothetical protein